MSGWVGKPQIDSRTSNGHFTGPSNYGVSITVMNNVSNFENIPYYIFSKSFREQSIHGIAKKKKKAIGKR